MENGEPRFSRVHLLRWVLCQRSRINRVYTDIYTDIKIANNTKINHIMVPFTDHYNIISIDRLPSKTKIGKDSWYFNNSLLCEAEVSSATRLMHNFWAQNDPFLQMRIFSGNLLMNLVSFIHACLHAKNQSQIC